MTDAVYTDAKVWRRHWGRWGELPKVGVGRTGRLWHGSKHEMQLLLLLLAAVSNGCRHHATCGTWQLLACSIIGCWRRHQRLTATATGHVLAHTGFRWKGLKASAFSRFPFSSLHCFNFCSLPFHCVPPQDHRLGAQNTHGTLFTKKRQITTMDITFHALIVVQFFPQWCWMPLSTAMIREDKSESIYLVFKYQRVVHVNWCSTQICVLFTYSIFILNDSLLGRWRIRQTGTLESFSTFFTIRSRGRRQWTDSLTFCGSLFWQTVTGVTKVSQRCRAVRNA